MSAFVVVDFDIVNFVEEEKYAPFWRYLISHAVTRYHSKRNFSGCGYFQLFLVIILCLYEQRYRPLLDYIKDNNNQTALIMISDIFMTVKGAVENNKHSLYKFITDKRFTEYDLITYDPITYDPITNIIKRVKTITDCDEISPCIIYFKNASDNDYYYVHHFFTIVKKEDVYWMLTSWGNSEMIITPAAIQIDETEFANLVTYLSNPEQRRENNGEFNSLMTKYFFSVSQGRYSSPNSRKKGKFVPPANGVTTMLNKYFNSSTQYLIGIVKTYKDEICSLVNHAAMLQPRIIERRRRRYTRRSPSHSHNPTRSKSRSKSPSHNPTRSKSRSKNRRRNRTMSQNKSRSGSRSRSPYPR